jgi:hypothetical protein
MSPAPFLMGLGHKSKSPSGDDSSALPASHSEMATMYERYKQILQHDIDRNAFVTVCHMVLASPPHANELSNCSLRTSTSPSRTRL